MRNRPRTALPAVLAVLAWGCEPPPSERERAEQAIVAQERRALDQWSRGDPLGYLDIDADDVTYFDDIGASSRIDGIDAMRTYLGSLRGKIPPHSYDLVGPKVQVYGDIGILTLRYQASTPDGSRLPEWKATSVYHRTDGQWRVVHAHWSLVKARQP